jgi:hypothetical protein
MIHRPHAELGFSTDRRYSSGHIESWRIGDRSQPRKSYASFTACWTLQGFFNTSPQVISLSIIGDIFFFHERTKYITV